MTSGETMTSVNIDEAVSEMYNDMITPEVDFRVETRGLHTTDTDGGMHMPDHEATIRIDPDGKECPLWVVGSKYEVVDHREVIKGFAHALAKAGIEATVDHKVYGAGCRIYSIFTLEKTFEIQRSGGTTKTVRPFFALTTSHDGSLRLGFMMGAKSGNKTYNISKTVYGNYAKHTKGINIEKTLGEIGKAMDAFSNDVIPMWENMIEIPLSSDNARNLIEDAVKKKIISKSRAKNVPVDFCTSVFDTYSLIVEEVSHLSSDKRATEEGAFDRNTKVGEYFARMSKTDWSVLDKTVEEGV